MRCKCLCSSFDQFDNKSNNDSFGEWFRLLFHVYSTPHGTTGATEPHPLEEDEYRSGLFLFKFDL